MRSRSRRLGAIGALASTLLAGACSSGNGSGSPDSADAAPSATVTGTGLLALSGVCPDPVVVQTAWVPEAEHGALYHLLGSGYRIDAAKKRVSGPLVSGGKATGVRIELRAGGPAIGFQNAGTQMYADPSITLGQVATDDAVSLAARQPVLAVVAPFDISPYMIMWDPKVHPGFRTIADIGQTNTKVLYFKGATYLEYLVGSGILRRAQTDSGYDGSPATYVASDGKIAQQGFATSEPYLYEKALPQWRKPVEFQLVNDTGYPIYPEAIVIRADRKQSLAACLRRLVPIIQRAQVDFVRHPEQTNKLISSLTDRYRVGYAYPEDQARFSVEAQVTLGIVGNGTDATLGNFDPARVKRIIDIVTPIFQAQKRPVKAGLRPSDIATNEFVDPSVGLSGS